MSYLTNLFLALDELLNCLLLRGTPEQTISVHAALAAQSGKRWGCVLCRVLSVLVQPNHCADSLAPGAMPTAAALRAGVLLVLVAGGLVFAARAALATL